MNEESTIFRETRQRIACWLNNNCEQLALSTSLGVFGDHSFARYIASELKQKGFKKITFISSNCSAAQLDGLPVITPVEEQLAALDAIFLGSMALPQNQQKILEDRGYTGATFAVPDGQTMCTEPRFDPVDTNALVALKDKHKGETFFVIGNGPSLNTTPPEQLRNGVCLAGNGIVLRPEFQPDYYFLIDSICVDAWQATIESLQMPILAVSHLAERMRGIKNTLFYPVSYHTVLTDLNPAYKGFFSGNTIICPMILFAAYMGAKRIVILGVDNNYSKLATKNYHFHKDYYKNTDLVIDKQSGKHLELRQQTGILHAVRTAQSLGVEVLDATPVDNNLGLLKTDYNQFI